MVNMPRNASQKAAVDWARVLAYANNGLQQDFGVISDNWTNWGNEWVIYQIYPGWGRVDSRVINLMDPASPDYYTNASGNNPPASSSDSRLASDFEYLASQDFIASRGIYHYSNYRYSRYDLGYHGSSWTGPYARIIKS
jgi:hypothetical protein